MSAIGELLTTREAAVVSGVEVRDINRLIDEHILPEALVSNEENRRVRAGACALVRFYFYSEKSLTADERKGAIRYVYERANRNEWTIHRWRRTRPNWVYRHHGFLTLNFDSFIAETLEEHEKLEKAREIVVEDPGILSGTPVVKGTRVPVYDIAAFSNKGLSIAEIKKSYPSVSEENIELAILYVKATPRRGRPKVAIKPDRGAAVSRRVFPRRSA